MAQVHRSPFELEIPNVDLATFIFSSGTRDSRSQPQYFDAENPALNFSLEQAEGWVKRWAKGLQDLGLRTNDKVLLYSGNSLYFPIVFWGVVASGCVFTGCSPSSSVEGRQLCRTSFLEMLIPADYGLLQNWLTNSLIRNPGCLLPALVI